MTGYKHDKNGNIVKIIHTEQYQRELDDGEGIEYGYDAGNRLVKVGTVTMMQAGCWKRENR